MINLEKNNIIELDTDARIETLYISLKEVLFERGIGLPVPTILGVLDLLKDTTKRSVLDG